VCSPQRQLQPPHAAHIDGERASHGGLEAKELDDEDEKADMDEPGG
jgi:hypothetical protein